MITPKEKYSVIRKIDSGGMAEVFLGQAEGMQGFQKRVAIKRVLPHLAENKKFIQMFLDEARLGLGMNHGNVVQVFDIGHSGNTYFIVMEYVDGTNLKRVMEKLRKQGATMPIEIAVFIMLEVCRGLAYAHSLADDSGKPIGIVHRDVSPPNILLSRQGEVKIVDFGLAKATSQLERTDPGIVKGKFAYLSPEAAFGRPVDNRADLFACGILLFELLTNQRLFLGETDLKTIQLVRRGEVPSIAEIIPSVPKTLEHIVRKTLSIKPEDRFQKADELAENLATFIFEYGVKVTGFDLQRFIAGFIEEDDRQIKVLSSNIDQMIQEELINFASLEEGSDSDSGSKQNDPVGAIPLDPFGFSGSRDWADGDQARGWEMDSSGDSSSGQWIEPDLIEKKHSSPAPMARASTPLPKKADAYYDKATSLAHILEGDASANPATPKEEAQGDIWIVAIGAATIVIIASLLVAYSMGWIP